MPVKKRLQRMRPGSADELTRQLTHEWKRPKKSGQPLIIVEGDANDPLHIYVIWDKWRPLNQTERSEIIMDVAENLGDEHFPAGSPITVAMGVTTDEAERMGIRAS